MRACITWVIMTQNKGLAQARITCNFPLECTPAYLRSGGDGNNGLECDIAHACCMIVGCTSEQVHISFTAGHAASCRCVECWRIQHISIERLSFVISGHQKQHMSELQQLQFRSVFKRREDCWRHLDVQQLRSRRKVWCTSLCDRVTC